MPFPGPETALAATIGAGDDEYFVHCKKARPGASRAQLRLFNDFHEDSTTYRKITQCANVNLPRSWILSEEPPTRIVKSPGSALQSFFVTS